MLAPAGGAPTESRSDRWSRWSGPVGVGLALLGVLVLGAAAFSIWIGNSPGWAYDFQAYYDAAQRLAATGSPYHAQTLGGPFRPGPFGLYLYSPPLAILFVPLTWLGEQGSVVLWLISRVATLALACALMPVSRAVRMATFGIAALSAPVLLDLNLGNVSLIVTFCAVLIWRWLDRPLAGAALAVALTLRPTMGVIALWWLLRGLWRPVAATAVVGLLIVAVTLPFVGLQGWFDYAAVLRNLSDVTGVRKNVDLGSAVLMFGGPAWAAAAALFAGYAVTAGAIVFGLRRDRELSFVVVLGGSLLLAPLLWDHYLTHLLIPAAFLASRGRWWGLLLPIAAWLPTLLAASFPELKGSVDGLLSLVALAGVVLPLAAPDRGEPAGSFLSRLDKWRAKRPARA